MNHLTLGQAVSLPGSLLTEAASKNTRLEYLAGSLGSLGSLFSYYVTRNKKQGDIGQDCLKKAASTVEVASTVSETRLFPDNLPCWDASRGCQGCQRAVLAWR